MPRGFAAVSEGKASKPAAATSGAGRQGERRTRRQTGCAALYLAGGVLPAGALLAATRLSPAVGAERLWGAAAAVLAVLLLCFSPAVAAGVLVWRGRAQKAPAAAAAVGMLASGLFLLGGQVLQTQLSRALAPAYLLAAACLAAGFFLFRRQVRETGGFAPGPKANGVR